MNKRDAVANILTKFYKQELPESGFVQLVSFVNENCSWTDEMLNNMRIKKFGKYLGEGTSHSGGVGNRSPFVRFLRRPAKDPGNHPWHCQDRKFLALIRMIIHRLQ